MLDFGVKLCKSQKWIEFCYLSDKNRNNTSSIEISNNSHFCSIHLRMYDLFAATEKKLSLSRLILAVFSFQIRSV